MVLRGADRLDAIGVEGMGGGGNKRGCSSAKDLCDSAGVVSWPTALMRDFVAPQPGLAVAFRQRREGPAGPERVAHIANGPFHAPFLIARTHLTRPRGEVIMGAQFQQSRVE